MRVMMLGSPGVGKGTQAQFICEKYTIPQISTGNILRQVVSSGSALGLQIKAFLDKGALVPDALIIAMVKERLQEQDCLPGFLLDGFPRTIAQAEALIAEQVSIDHVLVIDVPEEEIIKRLSGRRVHLPSGRSYHVDYNPPIQPGVDDVTGESLVQRDDDQESVVRERFQVYQAQTKPLIEFYTQLSITTATRVHHIDGTHSVDEVQAAIAGVLA